MLNRIFIIFIFICTASSAFTQIKPPVVKPVETETVVLKPEDKLGRELAAPGKNRNSIQVWGGLNSFLYTYTDKRYVGSDKGDYIIADSYHGGVEMIFADFSDYDPGLADLRAGFNISAMYLGRIKPVYLDAVTIPAIPAEVFPPAGDQIDRVWKFYTYPGVFIGVNKKWWAFDLGLTLDIWAYDEEIRQRYSGSTIVDSPGRGLIWGDMSYAMNFYLRAGREDKGYFDLSFYRMDYNPSYGRLQYRLVLPIREMFALKIGGFFYPTSAMFIEPVFKYGGNEISVKAGTIINYYDSNLNKIAIKESLFCNISYIYKW